MCGCEVGDERSAGEKARGHDFGLVLGEMGDNLRELGIWCQGQANTNQIAQRVRRAHGARWIYCIMHYEMARIAPETDGCSRSFDWCDVGKLLGERDDRLGFCPMPLKDVAIRFSLKGASRQTTNVGAIRDRGARRSRRQG